MMKRQVFQLAIVLVAQFSFAQAGQPKLPCAYSGAVLRDADGKVLSFTSAEMKSRATHKVDVSVGLMGNSDFKATFVLEVLVGPTGNVICVRRVRGLAVADAEVERSVRQWKFKPADKNGKAVASLGVMEFYLCNIDCGKEGRSTSLLD